MFYGLHGLKKKETLEEKCQRLQALFYELNLKASSFWDTMKFSESLLVLLRQPAISIQEMIDKKTILRTYCLFENKTWRNPTSRAELEAMGQMAYQDLMNQ